jgi:tetratricopeptide (TPR) repeat protein
MAKLGDTYFAAAAYYLDNHKDIDQALIWIDKAVKFNGEIDTYIFLKARIFGEIGNYKKAIDFGEQALEIAQRNKHKAFMMRIEATIEKWRNLSNH